jgi:hypothetical protein
VKNLEGLPKQVAVEELYDERLELILGKNFISKTLLGNEDLEAYIYKIKVPEDYDKDEIVITTYAYLDEEIADMKNFTITVVEPVIPDTESPDDGGSESDGDLPSPDDSEDSGEKKNFLSKLVDVIEDFFNSLFG